MWGPDRDDEVLAVHGAELAAARPDQQGIQGGEDGVEGLPDATPSFAQLHHQAAQHV